MAVWNEPLPEVFASYGGLPSPICMKLQGGYLGSNNHVQIDQFGFSVSPASPATGFTVETSSCSLPGCSSLDFLAWSDPFFTWTACNIMELLEQNHHALIIEVRVDESRE
jgi:hypothetical protein